LKMKRKTRYAVCLLAAAFLVWFTSGWADDGATSRSMIFFIGDGMGPQIVSIVKLYAEEALGRDLNMVLLANSGATGYMTTHSEDRMVTDSAASGTAMATGHRTNNGMVGVTPDGETVSNLFEQAVESGRSVGVVTTTSVTDATPASFLAHASSRDMEFDIARQIVDSGASVVLGGGWSYFLPPGQGKRPDGLDLAVEARSKGFDVAFNKNEMEASAGERLLGLFAAEDMPYERVRNADKIPSLAEMTVKALEILARDPDGFVLVVEGGRIDHAEHENSIADAVADFLAFDDAIAVGMADQGQDSTLTIIVSADHDCGGPAITAAGYGYPSYNQVDRIADESCRFVRWVSGDHTGTMVPVFARGPGCERFSGIQANTELYRDLASLLGL
jgi:alkaline phosphatase